MTARRRQTRMAELSRRGFLAGAAAGSLAIADRLALAQAMLEGGDDIAVEDIRGWGERPGVVDIGDNENPHGPSPMAIRAVAERMLDVNRYDFTAERALSDAIGRHHGFPEPPPPTSRWAPSGYPVYAEGGSSFILNLVAQRYGIAGDSGEIIEAEPAYGGITRFIETYRDRFGAEITTRRIPLTADHRHDLDAMFDAVTRRTTLVVITNPNNPTGTIVSRPDLESFVAALPGHVTVFVDEAYIHYVRERGYRDAIELTQKFDNVIVSRTFSKLYGLAGLRLGYAVATPERVEELRFFGNGQGIGSINCYAGIAALDDSSFLRRVRRLTNEAKDFFYAELDRLGLDYVPSHGAFVLVDAGTDGADLSRRMGERGIRLSRLGLDGLPRYRNFLRFSMGTAEELEVAVAVLADELKS